MSLIPSESSHFPDLIGQRHGYRGPTRKRVPVNRTRPEERPKPGPLTPSPEPEAMKEPEVEKQTEAIKEPEPVKQPEPVPQPDFLKALERIRDKIAPPPAPIVPPAEAVRKPAPVENLSAPKVPAPVERVPEPLPMEPPRPPVRVAFPVPRQRTVTQMRSKIQAAEEAEAAPVTRPRTPLRGLSITPPASTVTSPSPAQVADEPEFDFPDSPLPRPLAPRRSHAKLIRFVVCEVLALGLLLVSIQLGFSHRMPDDPVAVVAKILTIAAAIAAAVVPIVFYGLPETLPRNRR